MTLRRRPAATFSSSAAARSVLRLLQEGENAGHAITHFSRDAVDVERSHAGGGANHLAVARSILPGIIVCMFSARGRDIVSRLAASVARSWRQGLYLFMKDRSRPRQMSHSDNHLDDEPARSLLDEWRELTAVLRQGERDAREEGERAISAAIRDLHETWLPLLEGCVSASISTALIPSMPMRKLCWMRRWSGSGAPLMRRSRPRAASAGARRRGSAFAAGVRGFGWPALSPNPGRSRGADVRILRATTERL